ncbi:Neuropeptide FF receptor 2, partial [Branchiostoma belcheri]
FFTTIVTALIGTAGGVDVGNLFLSGISLISSESINMNIFVAMNSSNFTGSVDSTMNSSEVLSKIYADARFKQSTAIIALLIFSYVLTFALCIVGNSMVCFVILKIPRMRTVTNYFLLNLAVSDLLVAIFCMPFTLLDNIIRGWPLGNVMCKLTPAVTVVSVVASVFTLVAIAVD